MSCNYPVTAYYSSALNETGKRSLVFNQRGRYLGSDPTINKPITVPCGKCHGCKADQSLMWSIRAYHESQLHAQNSFITLTYDDAHLPADGKINKDHLQRFFKRLRKTLPQKIRYFACGEYGSKTRRPHYHAIIFGEDWLPGSTPVTDTLYTHKDLVNTWGMGMVSIAPATMSSICYTCGYVTKKMDDAETFVLMSRRPGIGHLWLDRYRDDLIRTGTVTIEGREYPVPKRYLAWNPDEFKNLKNERVAYAKQQQLKTDLYARRRQGDAKEMNLKLKKNRGDKL